MRIEELVYKSRKLARWSSYNSYSDAADVDGQRAYFCLRVIKHYNTQLIGVRISPNGHLLSPASLHQPILFSLGHGSVSDQYGLNKIFRVLGLNWRYLRDVRGGGARVVDYDSNQVWQ